MSEIVFTVLWAVYLLSTAMAFLLLWNITKTKGKFRFFSGLIRMLFVAVMLTPANLSTVPEFMAPAFVVALFDFLQGYEQGSFDAAINLGVAVVGALVLYIIYSVILLIVHSRRGN